MSLHGHHHAPTSGHPAEVSRNAWQRARTLLGSIGGRLRAYDMEALAMIVAIALVVAISIVIRSP